MPTANLSKDPGPTFQAFHAALITLNTMKLAAERLNVNYRVVRNYLDLTYRMSLLTVNKDGTAISQLTVNELNTLMSQVTVKKSHLLKWYQNKYRTETKIKFLWGDWYAQSFGEISLSLQNSAAENTTISGIHKICRKVPNINPCQLGRITYLPENTINRLIEKVSEELTPHQNRSTFKWDASHPFIRLSERNAINFFGSDYHQSVASYLKKPRSVPRSTFNANAETTELPGLENGEWMDNLDTKKLLTFFSDLSEENIIPDPNETSTQAMPTIPESPRSPSRYARFTLYSPEKSLSQSESESESESEANPSFHDAKKRKLS